MHRALRPGLALVVLPALLVGCASSGEPDDPVASTGDPAPSESATPSVEPSSEPEPEPEPQRFDGVDVAAVLLPTDPASEVDGVGPWAAAPRDALVPGLDAEAFAASPECQASVGAAAGAPVLEVVEAGYEYDGVLSPRVVVARMPSPEVASAFVEDLATAAATCEGVDGEGGADDVVALATVVGPAGGELADAGLTVVLHARSGEPEYAPLVLTSEDELVVLHPQPSGPGDPGSAQRAIDAIETQLGALRSAAAG